MVEQILQIGDILVQKRYITYLRVFFNIVLVASLSSYVYIYFYGNYDFYSITDYKEIFRFFLSGEFIKVSSIFFLSFLMTNIISSILFDSLNSFTRNQLKKVILRTKGANDMEEFEEAIQSEMERKNIQKPPRILLILYPYLKEMAESEEFFEAIQEIERNKHELRNSFLFVVRLIICLIFYYVGSVIGLGLLVLGTVISIIFLLLIILLNQFYDLIPELLSIVSEKLDMYFKKHEQEKPHQ